MFPAPTRHPQPEGHVLVDASALPDFIDIHFRPRLRPVPITTRDKNRRLVCERLASAGLLKDFGDRQIHR